MNRIYYLKVMHLQACFDGNIDFEEVATFRSSNTIDFVLPTVHLWSGCKLESFDNARFQWNKIFV